MHPGFQTNPGMRQLVAAALYELSTYNKNGKQYRSTADKIVENLANNYPSPVGENKGFILEWVLTEIIPCQRAQERSQ